MMSFYAIFKQLLEATFLISRLLSQRTVRCCISAGADFLF